MRVGLMVNLINVAGNLLLIYPTRVWHGLTLYGAGWGVVGAAAAVRPPILSAASS